MIWWYWLIFVAVILLFFLGTFWWGLKKAIYLAMNSILGFFALFAVKLFLEDLLINLWSILLTAIFGIIGLIIVVILHLLGIAF